jgi:hypothetical protein
MTTIRPATPEDCEALARVHVTAWRESYSDILPAVAFETVTVPKRLQIWREFLDKPVLDPPVYVAERNGETVGFADGGESR